MMGVSMNRHEADARAMVTPVSTSHSQGELASGPASDPRIRMNPHGAMDRLTQCPPDPERPNATASCDPRTSSGTTIRAPGPA